MVLKKVKDKTRSKKRTHTNTDIHTYMNQMIYNKTQDLANNQM